MNSILNVAGRTLGVDVDDANQNIYVTTDNGRQVLELDAALTTSKGFMSLDTDARDCKVQGGSVYALGGADGFVYVTDADDAPVQKLRDFRSLSGARALALS